MPNSHMSDWTCLIPAGATVNLPIEAKKYMRNLVEQAMLQFFVAVKVRETKQLFLKVRRCTLCFPHSLTPYTGRDNTVGSASAPHPVPF